MTNKEKARKIARYAGNKCQIVTNTHVNKGIIIGFYKEWVWVRRYNPVEISGYSAKTVHPILRSIDQITDEEIEVLNNLPCNNFTEIDRAYVVHEFVGYFLLDKDEADYLRSIGIDCDGLIDAGIARKDDVT